MQDIIFITIKEEEEKFPLYKVENKTSNVILKYCQKGENHAEYCDSGESKRFAWDNLYGKHKVYVEAWTKSPKSNRRL